MSKFLACLLLLATLLPAADKKSKSEKPPETTMLDFVAKREDGLILLDGVVGIKEIERPLIGLRIRFELFAAGKKLISQQHVVISQQLLVEGDEVPFYLKCKDHARAVVIMVSVRAKKRMFLRLENAGPHGIE